MNSTIIIDIQNHDPKDVKSLQKRHNMCVTDLCLFHRNSLELQIGKKDQGYLSPPIRLD